MSSNVFFSRSGNNSNKIGSYNKVFFKNLRAFCFLSGLAMTLLLTGCTAILWTVNKPTELGVRHSTQFKDIISGAVKYKNLQLTTTQPGKVAPVDIPSEGVAFIGKENIYILTQGVGELLRLNDNFNKLPFSGTGRNGALRLRVLAPVEDDTLMKFSDAFTVVVDSVKDKLTYQQVDLLKELGFEYKGSGFERKIDIKGVIIPRKNFKYPLDASDKLSKSYRVEFYTSKGVTKLHAGRLAENIIVTPVALAADIIFFPISISVLGLVAKN